MTNNNVKSAVLKARIFDEPFAIKKLAYNGYKLVQGTDQDDWNHIDIKLEYNNNLYSIDVKRNDKFNSKSVNFCFTYINSKGEMFPFKNNAYFFFIDDLNYKCYLVLQSTFKDLLFSKGIELKNPKNGKARLINKKLVEQISAKILECDKYDKLYLDTTNNVDIL